MRRRVVAALVLALGGLAGCSDPEPKVIVAPVQPPSASVAPIPSPTKPPAVNSDGCLGLVNAAQVSKASGLNVQASAGDAAGAAGQYTQALTGMGLTATVRMCAFNNAGGDQVTVIALAFPDAAQATKLFSSGVAAGALQPVGGIGDAALTDKSKALVVRRGKAVVAVYLVAAKSPDANHLAPMQAVATAALAKT
jgi:hypothetical protein